MSKGTKKTKQTANQAKSAKLTDKDLKQVTGGAQVPVDEARRTKVLSKY